jgi:D-allulose-6-phosphate 3-epimerase
MKHEFSISLMCADYLNLKEQLTKLNDKADYYHIDIMDGHYCKNITLSPDYIRGIKRVTKLPIEAHLMVENPNDFIDMVAAAGADVISVHAETINTNAFRTLNSIKSKGLQVGVALNPATPLEEIQYYANRLDLLTIMTVDVGYAGQSFIPEMLDKIKKAKQWKEEFGYTYKIQIDGSCNEKTFARLKEAGAEIFILGTMGLFNLDKDVGIAYEKMENIFNNS